MEREKAIFINQAQESGKPQEIMDKMVEGKVKRFLSEVSLLSQDFVKDSDITVREYLHQNGATAIDFVRLRVDGVYDSDPEINENAKFYDTLTFDDAIHKNLKVMDATALTLARDHKLPINVFNVNQPDAVRDIISGKKIGTLIN